MPPPLLAPIILAFAPLFTVASWQHVLVLLWGAILTPGKRTVTSALRIMGRQCEKDFQNYHRLLNRARWSPRRGSQILLRLLVQRFAPTGPLLFGIDDTIERRWGSKIRARGIYRDPVRSSDTHFVKASGLRWLSLMLLVPVPWAQRVWALPFLTSLAPSERYYQNRPRTPKSLLDWATQQCFQLRRWCPNRKLTLVADGAFAALDFLHKLHTVDIHCVTRLRLDARLYRPAPARSPHRPGRPRVIGSRLPALRQHLNDPQTRWTQTLIPNWYGRAGRTVELCSATAIWYHGGLPPAPIRWVLLRDPEHHFDPLALLSTDLAATPMDIVHAYVSRWQVEVTFEESRAHLGLETQRQWSDNAIARTTPLLLALFSMITLMADRLHSRRRFPILQTAWYAKPVPTFSDALATVRKHLWNRGDLFISPRRSNVIKSPNALFQCFSDALCYAA